MPEPSAWCENEIFPDGGDYYAELTNIRDSDGDNLYLVALGAMESFSVDFDIPEGVFPEDLVNELTQRVRVVYRIPHCDPERCGGHGIWVATMEDDFSCICPIPYGYLSASCIQDVMESWATRLEDAEFFAAFLEAVCPCHAS